MADKTRKTDIIAHRGASAYAPENTLSAFYLAAALGADWFELDCTLTRDDALLVIHDDKVDRTTNGKGRVSELTLAECKRLDAGIWKGEQFAGEQLPTLEEALTVAKERHIGIYIEIKNSADDGPCCHALVPCGKNNRRLHAAPPQTCLLEAVRVMCCSLGKSFMR